MSIAALLRCVLTPEIKVSDATCENKQRAVMSAEEATGMSCSLLHEKEASTFPFPRGTSTCLLLDYSKEIIFTQI